MIDGQTGFTATPLKVLEARPDLEPILWIHSYETISPVHAVDLYTIVGMNPRPSARADGGRVQAIAVDPQNRDTVYGNRRRRNF